MARPYRLQLEHCFYHITSCGNDKKKIFFNNTDFEKFLEYILTTKEKQIAMYLIRRYTGLINGEIGKIFKMKAQAVSKAGIKIERLMEESREIRTQVKKLISTFQG